jgi:hypothetical protein
MPEKRDMQRQIEKAKEDGLAKLGELVREGSLTDQSYRLAQRRIVGLCFETLRLYDQARLQFHAYTYTSNQGRDEHSQASLNDLAAALLRELELNLFRVLQEAIQNICSDLPNTRPRQATPQVRAVIEQSPHQEYPEWLQGIGTLCKGLLQYAGFALLLGMLFGNPYIAIFVPIASYVLLHDQPGGFIVWGIIPSFIAVVVWLILLVL